MQFPRTGENFLNDLKSLDTKREPIISELLYEGDVWMMSADAGSGKSTIVSNLALSISSGSPLFGVLTTRKKRVYMLQTEGDYEESIERMRMMTKKIRVDADYLAWDCFKFLDLKHEASLNSVLSRMDAFKPEVIIVDPIYKLTSDDISEGAGALQVVRFSDALKDRYKGTVILIHHNTKETHIISDGKRFEKTDAYYGHSFIKNHVRTSYSLSLDSNRQSPVLTRKKGRGSDSLEKIHLHYDAETMTCQMELKQGTVLDRIKIFANTCKLNSRSTDFNEVQATCGLSVAYLRKLKTDGMLEKVFEFKDGKQGRQDWIPSQ